MIIGSHKCSCKEKCIVLSKQSNFSVYGTKTNYQLVNKNQLEVSKFIVDDCLLKEKKEDEKCDYLFLIKNDKVTDGYFVELKGSDVLKAISQLQNSIGILGREINGTMYGRIVPTKVALPNLNSNNYYKKLKLKLNGNLIVKNTVCIDNI